MIDFMEMRKRPGERKRGRQGKGEEKGYILTPHNACVYSVSHTLILKNVLLLNIINPRMTKRLFLRSFKSLNSDLLMIFLTQFPIFTCLTLIRVHLRFSPIPGACILKYDSYHKRHIL